MSTVFTRWSIVVLFSAALGHFAWRTYGPAPAPEFTVGGNVTALRAADAQHNHLYLRRTFYLSKQPEHGWLQVAARDRVKLYVNGTLLAERSNDGFHVALLEDVTPHLHVGKNVIAIAVEQAAAGQVPFWQSSVGERPLAAVEGAYWINGREHLVAVDGMWRSRAIFERRAAWWFATDFDDNHWPTAERIERYLRAPVETPPRAIQMPPQGGWITTPFPGATTVAVRREIEMADRPRVSWLRVTTNGSYRLAVNGVVADVQDEQLTTTRPGAPVQRIYDVTPFVRRGRNVVAIRLTSTPGPPSLLADLEIEDQHGRRQVVGTDDRWLASQHTQTDWLDPGMQNSDDWQPCRIERGGLSFLPWDSKRQRVTVSLPWRVAARQLGWQIGFMMLVGAATFLACLSTGHLGRRLSPKRARPGAPPWPFAALILPGLAMAAMILSTYDPRIARQDVYQHTWVVAVILSIPLQWLLFLLCRSRGTGNRRRAKSQTLISTRRRAKLADYYSWAILCVLIVLGFWLRWREIDVKPLQHDEASAYRSTQGLFERGWPSRLIHEDLPPKYIETSELVYFGNALAALAFDDERYIVRIPAIVWGTLTIPLIFYVGARLFGPQIGLIAATVYTLAPICVHMSCFGRYFSQVQFFALLTVYLFWRTIRGSGPIDRRALCWTAASFVAMYLSWEGSALIAIGMILTALVYRRGHLQPMLLDPSVWVALVLVASVVVIQLSNRMFQLTQFLTLGTGISDLTLKTMWRYPQFNLWYSVWESSWNRDALLPMCGLLLASCMAVRHGFQRPVRFLLIIFVSTCFIHALLLPLYTWRYSYHLIPLLILLSAAAFAAVGRWLTRLACHWPAYSRVMGALSVILLVAVSSGGVLQLPEMTAFRIYTYDLPDLKFHDVTGPANYLRKHIRDGDILLASTPHVVDTLLEDRPVDYWPQSTFYIEAVLDDRRPLPLDRYCGATMLTDREAMEDLFAREHRIWYVVVPSRHEKQNTSDVSAYLRQHMDVVYEDFTSMVLFRGNHHRPASLRRENEQSLREAGTSTLP